MTEMTIRLKYGSRSIETDMHYMHTQLRYGRHKGKIVSEVLKTNPHYIPIMYEKYEDFYISDLVWNSLSIHKENEDFLNEQDQTNKKDVEDIISKTSIFHEEKIKKYKTIFMILLESKLKCN